MPTVFANGGIIGKTLDFTSTSFYNPNIQYVGGATASTSGGSSTISVTFSSITGGIGGGVLTGDLVVALLAAAGSSNFTMSMNTAGYTNLFDLYANNSYDANLGLFYKVMGATPDTSAQTGSFLTGGDSVVLGIQVWRGVNTSTPIGASASAINTGSTLANPPAITTTAKGSKVIAFGNAAASYSGSQGFTFGGDLENTMAAIGPNTSNAATLGVGAVKMLGGVRQIGTVVDPIAFSAAVTNTNTSWAAVTFELIPITSTPSLMNSGIWDVGGRYPANTV
jgi:hypothetical protein